MRQISVTGLLLAVLITGVSCANRDFHSNPIMDQIYTGPVVVIYNPAQNDIKSGNVLVTGQAAHISGIDRVELISDGVTNVLTGSRLPGGGALTNYFFTGMMYYTSTGYKTLEAFAVDTKGIRSAASIQFNVNGPMVRITNDSFIWNYYIFTNQASLLLGGYVSYNDSPVTRVDVQLKDYEGNETTRAATLTGTNWRITTPVSLYPNRTNILRVIAWSDSNLQTVEEKLVIHDNIAPSISALYPANNQEVSNNLYFQARVTDNLSVPYNLSVNSWIINWSSVYMGFYSNPDRHEGSYGWMNKGYYTNIIYAVDQAGNHAVPLTNVFRVDMTGPVIMFRNPQSNNVVPAVTHMDITAVDQLSAVSSVYISLISNGTYQNMWSDAWMGYTNWNYYTGSVIMSNGPTNVYFYAVDANGNYSRTNVLPIIVDGGIPYIELWSIGGGFYTNAASFDVYGKAVVSPGYTISQISFTLDNGATWQPINKAFDTGTNEAWYTNTVTPAVSNQRLSLQIRAISSTGKTNYSWTPDIVIDTVPPRLLSISPSSGNVFGNVNNFNYSVRLDDQMSGLWYLSNEVTGIGYPSFTNLGVVPPGIFETNLYANCYLPFGGIITNILHTGDRAGNIRTITNIVSVYPAIFVGTNGNDANPGFGDRPLASIQKGIDRAKSLGVTNVLVAGGVYTQNWAGQAYNVKLESGISVVGSYSPGYNYIDEVNHPSIINGQNMVSNVVVADNVQGMIFAYFGLFNGGSGGSYGGGMRVVNSSFGAGYLYISNNQAQAGGGLYVKNSGLYLTNVIFDQNNAMDSPVLLAEDSYLVLASSSIRRNGFIGAGAGLSSLIHVKNGSFFMNWNVITNNSLGSTRDLAVLNLEGSMATNIILNSYFVNNHFNSNTYCIYMNFSNTGMNSMVNVLQNTFAVSTLPGPGTRYGIYENLNPNVYLHDYNQYYTNFIDAAYHDFVNGDLTNIFDVNDEIKTGTFNYDAGYNIFTY